MFTTDQIATMLRRKPKSDKFQGLSTGLTLLNLACTGTPNVGLFAGHYYLLVGDSASGKTWIAHTLLAEASINSSFDDYALIYDDVEGGSLMDIERYFGKKLAERIEPPSTDGDGNPVFSTTCEEFYDRVDDLIKKDRPFIWIEDSMDSLDTEDDSKKIDKLKSARKRGKIEQESGTYGTSKAKINSNRLRRLMAGLKRTNSILVIVSQTRDNLGFGFQTKTRAGGRALRFYATLEFWLSIKSKIKKTVRKKNRTLGIQSLIKVEKNRVSGKSRSVLAPIYYSAGIDDVGTNIAWLIAEGHWQGTLSKVKAKEFDFVGTIEGLIELIQERDKERKLRKIVTGVWREIESASSVSRKNKYE